MTNVPLIFQPLYKYAEFNGRSRRSEFWLWVLFRIIVGMLLGTGSMFLIAPVMVHMHDHPEMFLSRYFTIWPMFSLLHIALLLPTLAVGVRRLHDINRSGWWLLLPHVVAIVGVLVFFVLFGTSLVNLIVAAKAGGDNISDAQGLQFAMQMIGSLFLCVLLPVLIAEIVMLVFYVTDGTAGPNRFGNDPKGRGANASATF